MSLFTFKSWQGTEYFVLFSEHFHSLFQLLVQMHKAFSLPLCIFSFLQREGNVCELGSVKALHWSLNGESKMPLQVTQDFTKVLRYILSPFSHQWWLMPGVNVFTERPPLTPACPLSHMRISLTLGDLTDLEPLCNGNICLMGAKASMNQAIVAKGPGLLAGLPHVFGVSCFQKASSLGTACRVVIS